MRTRLIRFRVIVPVAALGLSLALLGGCDDPAQRQAAAEARARAAREAEAALAQKEAEAKAAAERVEAEKKALAEQAAAAATKAKNAVGDCCQALARRGFEERNMEDMAAKKLCLDLEAKGSSLEAVRDVLSAALEKRELPAACSQ